MYSSMHLYIKNMVSNRCKLIVQSELENINIPFTRLVLGEVDIMQTIERGFIEIWPGAFREQESYAYRKNQEYYSGNDSLC